MSDGSNTTVTNNNIQGMKEFISGVKDFFAFIYEKTKKNMRSFNKPNVTNSFNLSNELFNGNENDNNKFPGIINILKNQVYKDKEKYSEMKSSLTGEILGLVNNLLRWIDIIDNFKENLDKKINEYLTDHISNRIQSFSDQNITEYIQNNSGSRDINSYLEYCKDFLVEFKEDKDFTDRGMDQYINEFMNDQSKNSLNDNIQRYKKFINEMPTIVTGKVTEFLVKEFETGLGARTTQLTGLKDTLQAKMDKITGVLGTNKKLLNNTNIQTIIAAYKGNNNNIGINVIIEQAGSIIEENNKQKQQLIEQFNGLKDSYKEVLDENKEINKNFNNSELKASKSAFNTNKTNLNKQIKTKVLFSLQKKVETYDDTVNAFKITANDIINRSKEIKNFANKTNGLGKLITMSNSNKETITNIIGKNNLKNNGNLIKALQGVADLINNSSDNQEVPHPGNTTTQIIDP